MPIFFPLYALMDSRVDEMNGCVGVVLDPWKIWSCRRYMYLLVMPIGPPHRTTKFLLAVKDV